MYNVRWEKKWGDTFNNDLELIQAKASSSSSPSLKSNFEKKN